MTLAARNLSLRFAFVVLVAVGIGVAAAYILVLNGTIGTGAADVTVEQILASGGALLTAVLGLLLAAIYLRLFRRTPSLSVFFVVWFFLAMTLDVLKLAQLVLPFTALPQFAPAVSRLTVFGHIAGVMALFGAGLYAGGVRMQRHGTAMLVVGLIALGLAWSVPIDTAELPEHLVYRAGVRASLQSTLALLLVVAVVNFVHAALNNGNPRQLLSALAVALLAAGRELLFYRIEPWWIVAGAGAVITGGILFASQNYRDFLVS